MDSTAEGLSNLGFVIQEQGQAIVAAIDKLTKAIDQLTAEQHKHHQEDFPATFPGERR